MVESNSNIQKAFKNNNVMQRVLECFDVKELLEWRYFDKRFGNELVPRCLKNLRYTCPDEDEKEEETFHTILTYARKVEISRINGKESHLHRVNKIAD